MGCTAYNCLALPLLWRGLPLSTSLDREAWGQATGKTSLIHHNILQESMVSSPAMTETIKGVSGASPKQWSSFYLSAHSEFSSTLYAFISGQVWHAPDIPVWCWTIRHVRLAVPACIQWHQYGSSCVSIVTQVCALQHPNRTLYIRIISGSSQTHRAPCSTPHIKTHPNS